MRKSICSSIRNTVSKGWINEDEEGDAAFWAQLNLYVDAANLAPEVFRYGYGLLRTIKVLHHMRSYPISLNINGKLSLLPDGRLVAQVTNENAVRIATDVEPYGCYLEVGIPSSSCSEFESYKDVAPNLRFFPTVYLQILPGDINLNMITAPIK